MPYGLVVNFTPLSSISAHCTSGRHLHALFLTLVSSVDQDLGNDLHDSSSNKAFTLSPLQVADLASHGDLLRWKYDQNIPAGTSCWWRISLLDDQLFGRLSRLWLNMDLSRNWRLGGANLQITSILGTPQLIQPWVGACSYQELYENASDQERLFAFYFATPTSFRQGHYDSSLPTAEAVFSSLWKRWQCYSGIPFDSLNLEGIFPSFFRIQTEMVSSSQGKFIGCVGDVSFRLLGQADPHQVKLLNVLADFAVFCGVGRKTPMGMGMVRRRVRF